MERQPGSFRVRVFPYQSWHVLPLSLSINTPSQDDRILNLGNLMRHVRGMLLPLLPSAPVWDNVSYHVVLVKSLDEIKTVDEYTNKYLSIKPGAAIQERLNRRPMPNTMTVSFKNHNNAFLFIMAAPRDIARQFYTVPSISLASLGYEVAIYEPTDTEQKREMRDYIKDVNEANEKSANPLALVEPVAENDLDKRDRIVFVARRGPLIIGYCACSLIPYREEIDELLVDALAVYERDPDVMSRYFMEEVMRSVYEIEGLSVHPRETRKKISLVLLYTALHFIREPQITPLYPVTHIVTQSASYITKLLLTTDETFGFRYHGPNNFMNQGFVQTLSNTTKQVLVRIIAETVGHYNDILDKSSNRTTLRRLLEATKERDATNVAQEMLKSIIQLYQLYFLLLQSGTEMFNVVLIDAFRKLLSYAKQLTVRTSKIRLYETLSSYFDRNLTALVNYKAEPTVLRHLSAFIFTQYEIQPKQSLRVRLEFRDYGFLLTTEARLPQHQGYEVIYETINNIDALNSLLGMSGAQSAIVIFGMINALLLVDLKRHYNYEIRVESLERIRSQLEKLALHGQEATIRSTREELEQELGIRSANVVLNKFIAYTLLNIPEGVSDGIDTILSFKRLRDNWANTERAVLRSVASLTQPQPLPVIPQLPSVPTERESLYRELNALREILTLNPPSSALILFEGGQYSVEILRRHFVTLLSLRETIGLDETEQIGYMEVENDEDEEIVYELSDFIDTSYNPLEGFEDNVMNRAGSIL